MTDKAPLEHKVGKAEFKHLEPRLRDELLAAQTQLRTAGTFSLALIIIGTPAAGRSETINELLEWLDPKFVAVHAFDQPDWEDKQHPLMWRYWRTLPARGRIAFYFAAWYTDYLRYALRKPRQLRRHEQRMVERIRALETMLTADRVRVVKIHLHVDAKTQRARLSRLRSSRLTRWRVTPEDLWLAQHYKRVEKTIERCLKATDHASAPWHSIAAHDEEYRLLRVGEILRNELLQGLGAAAPVARPALTRPARNATVKVSASALRACGLAQHSSPAVPQAEYERELELLQGRLALLLRRSKFRKRSLVLAFEGLDAAGKGGAIRRLTHALDARQYQVVPISAPTAQERAYPYLWRFWRCLPEHADIAIFDRSWYGRVLVERVRGLAAPADWQRAYAEIVEFEKQLTESGCVVAKFWLDVSKREQLARLKERDQDPLKRFKVDPEDWVNRRFYDDYQVAAAHMIQRTHADDARWTVVAADNKHHARLAVLRTVCETLEREL
jgi:polyphosphate:AMP phosphotransferase